MVNGDWSHEIKRCLLLGQKSMTNLDKVLKSRDITLRIKVHSPSYHFSSSQVWMWEMDHKEGWAPKNWCFWTVVLEKTLESPLDCKEIKPVNPKENQPWIFIGRTDAEAEAPILRPPDTESWLIGKGPDSGKDWRQEKRTTEDEMVGWHHWLNGYEFDQTLGDSDRQGCLAWCNPLGHKESDTTKRLNNNNDNNIQKGRLEEVKGRACMSGRTTMEWGGEGQGSLACWGCKESDTT